MTPWIREYLFVQHEAKHKRQVLCYCLRAISINCSTYTYWVLGLWGRFAHILSKYSFNGNNVIWHCLITNGQIKHSNTQVINSTAGSCRDVGPSLLNYDAKIDSENGAIIPRYKHYICLILIEICRYFAHTFRSHFAFAVNRYHYPARAVHLPRTHYNDFR